MKHFEQAGCYNKQQWSLVNHTWIHLISIATAGTCWLISNRLSPWVAAGDPHQSLADSLDLEWRPVGLVYDDLQSWTLGPSGLENWKSNSSENRPGLNWKEMFHCHSKTKRHTDKNQQEKHLWDFLNTQLNLRASGLRQPHCWLIPSRLSSWVAAAPALYSALSDTCWFHWLGMRLHSYTLAGVVLGDEAIDEADTFP